MPELAPPAEIVQTDSAPSLPTSPLEGLTPDERHAWRNSLTGEIPKPKADPAPAKEEPEVPEEADSEPAPTPGSEPDKQQEHRQKTKADTERRFQQLLDEIKTLKQQLTERSAPREQASQPAAEPTKSEAPTLEDKDDKGQFKYNDINDFYRDLAKWEAKQAIESYKKDADKAAKESKQKEQRDVVMGEWNNKVEAARKKYEDFDAVALKTQLPIEIKQGSVVDMFTLESQYGADVLYHLTKDDCAELARVSKLNPIAQARELTKIELQFSEKPKEPATPQTRAPKPPSEVGGRGTQPSDSLLSAAQANDYRAFKAEANRRALAAK